VKRSSLIGVENAMMLAVMIWRLNKKSEAFLEAGMPFWKLCVTANRIFLGLDIA